VIADSRAPRDGRYIERIGFYNPNTNPATINLDFDKAYDWLTKGAQPTDTVKAILSYKGVLYKKHLMGGVKKGAFDEEEAQERLEKWIAEKESNIRAKKESIENDSEAAMKLLLAAETKKKEERAAAIAARNSELAEEEAKEGEEAASSEESEVDKAAEEPAEKSEDTDTEKKETE
jgi:small subunit ribosomal protein S16